MFYTPLKICICINRHFMYFYVKFIQRFNFCLKTVIKHVTEESELATEQQRRVLGAELCSPQFQMGFLGGASSKESACQCGRREMLIWSLGQENSLKEEMAPRSSILAGRIPWTGAWWATDCGVAKSRTQLSVWVPTPKFHMLILTHNILVFGSESLGGNQV